MSTIRPESERKGGGVWCCGLSHCGLLPLHPTDTHPPPSVSCVNMLKGVSHRSSHSNGSAVSFWVRVCGERCIHPLVSHRHNHPSTATNSPTSSGSSSLRTCSLVLPSLQRDHYRLPYSSVLYRQHSIEGSLPSPLPASSSCHRRRRRGCWCWC